MWALRVAVGRHRHPRLCRCWRPLLWLQLLARGMDDIDEDILPRMVSHGVPSRTENNEEELESNGLPFRSATSPLRPADDYGRGLHHVLWMSPRDMEWVGKLAYGTLSNDAPTSNPAPYSHAVLMEATERVHYRMFPSSRGHMLFRLDSRANRDAMVDLSPIENDGGPCHLRALEVHLQPVHHQVALARRCGDD